MGKKAKRVKSMKPNRKAPKKGDTYVITTDISAADVDGDGVTDLVAVHKVAKNGEAFVDATVVWYGLDNATTEAFEAALDEAGIADGVVETDKFQVVAKSWKGLTKFLKKINDLADVLADDVD